MFLPVILLLTLISLASARSPNIVNGEDVDRPGKYPYQGSMQMFNGWHFCGCSLIDHHWAVTASHCVDGSSARETRVVFGLHDQKKRYGQPKMYRVSEIIMHEEFKQGSGFFPNDIALLRINENIEYNDYVQPIKMADNTDFMGEDDECVISGWGRMKIGEEFTNPDILQETHTRIISQEQCRKVWQSTLPKDGRDICIFTGKSTACQGDSGGPLACRHAGGEFQLLGATSFGPGNCAVSAPAGYASIPYYLSWINNKIDNYVVKEEECVDSDESCSLWDESAMKSYCNDKELDIVDQCCVSCKPYLPTDEGCSDSVDYCARYGPAELQVYCNDKSIDIADICCNTCKPYV